MIPLIIFLFIGIKLKKVSVTSCLFTKLAVIYFNISQIDIKETKKIFTLIVWLVIFSLFVPFFFSIKFDRNGRKCCKLYLSQ